MRFQTSTNSLLINWALPTIALVIKGVPKIFKILLSLLPGDMNGSIVALVDFLLVPGVLQ